MYSCYYIISKHYSHQVEMKQTVHVKHHVGYVVFRTSRWAASWPLRHAAIPDYHKNKAFPLVKCIRRYP